MYIYVYIYIYVGNGETLVATVTVFYISFSVIEDSVIIIVTMNVMIKTIMIMTIMTRKILILIFDTRTFINRLCLFITSLRTFFYTFDYNSTIMIINPYPLNPYPLTPTAIPLIMSIAPL
jgi:hypothetical protein